MKPKSVLSIRDLFSEVLTGLTARPGRTLLTALGTILGVGALVSTLGLAKTAGSQIVARFDELEATQVVVEPRENAGRPAQQTSAIPWDAEDRLVRLNGVEAAGTLSQIELETELVRSVPINDPSGLTEFQIPMLAASPGIFDAARTELFTGRYFDTGHDQNQNPVAVIGPAVAKKLNISRVNNAPTIFVGEEPITIVGILASTARKAELLNAIIVPEGYAQERFDLKSPTSVLIEVDVGAANLIAAQAPTVLAPNEPKQLRAQAPPSPKDIRSDVESDVNSLFLLLGAVSLVVGAIGIANVTLVSVLERTGEIGLRRALGATRSHVALQFLTESIALGLLAGLLGACGGVVTTVAISANREWTPVLELWLPAAAPLLGATIGLVAGTYPALKASNIEPITALRGGK